MTLLHRRTTDARTGRIEFSSPLPDGDLLLLSALTRHWHLDATGLKPAAGVTPQVAAESLRRIASTVLAPRGIRLHGSVALRVGDRRLGTVSVRHGRVTSRHTIGAGGGRGVHGPIQADPTVVFDLAVPTDVRRLAPAAPAAPPLVAPDQPPLA